jgi:hypothetical protein
MMMIYANLHVAQLEQGIPHDKLKEKGEKCHQDGANIA